jgi:tRNA (guanosine-2'-O-)-methyltransferase
MTPERKKRIDDVLNRRQPDLVILMENVDDPHNISAVMRSCDSVGIQEIFVLNTKMQQHDYFGKRSSASAAAWLNVHQFDDIETCITALKKRNYKLLATHLNSESNSLYEIDLTQPIALVFGNEHDGVSEELLRNCDGNFIIPQVGMVKSLNISVACAVSLYEAFRQRSAKGLYDGNCRIVSTQRAELFEQWSSKEK